MPDLQFEFLKGYPTRLIAGADEVGRGCIAGPVVAAAIVLPRSIDFKKDFWLAEVNDSKKVSAPLREKLTPLIYQWALAAAIGFASVEEIDRLNIFHASHLAIVRAITALKVVPDHVLIDGKFLPQGGFTLPATAVIQGDQKSLSIAAASIIAKVWRDQHMAELDKKYPGYGFAKHKGYPTVAHSLALKKSGVTILHRRSFKTVSILLKDGSL
jgi:ribonuclease HII